MSEVCFHFISSANNILKADWKNITLNDNLYMHAHIHKGEFAGKLVYATKMFPSTAIQHVTSLFGIITSKHMISMKK